MALMNLKPAHQTALKEFYSIVPEAAAEKAQVEFDPKELSFKVPYLGKEYKVYHPEGQVVCEGAQEVQVTDQIVLLHYLSHCSNRAVEGTKVAFQELPSGSIYIGPFTNRSVRPLVSIFGDNQDKLVEAAKLLGGWQEDLGDIAVTVPVLPKIPITFVLWEGDDEFPPSGNVLFDASAASQLHTEDYALLPGLALWEMKKLINM